MCLLRKSQSKVRVNQGENTKPQVYPETAETINLLGEGDYIVQVAQETNNIITGYNIYPYSNPPKSEPWNTQPVKTIDCTTWNDAEQAQMAMPHKKHYKRLVKEIEAWAKKKNLVIEIW